jgi:hypothetical protein
LIIFIVKGSSERYSWNEKAFKSRSDAQSYLLFMEERTLIEDYIETLPEMDLSNYKAGDSYPYMELLKSTTIDDIPDNWENKKDYVTRFHIEEIKLAGVI